MIAEGNGSEPAPLPLAARVNRLFDAHRRFDEPEHTNAQVAADVAELLGDPVDADLINSIRTGSCTNPPGAVTAAIARHFGIPAFYLQPRPDDVGAVADFDRQLRVFVAYRNARVPYTALRGGDLSAESVEELIDMLANLEPDRRGQP